MNADYLKIMEDAVAALEQTLPRGVGTECMQRDLAGLKEAVAGLRRIADETRKEE